MDFVDFYQEGEEEDEVERGDEENEEDDEVVLQLVTQALRGNGLQ